MVSLVLRVDLQDILPSGTPQEAKAQLDANGGVDDAMVLLLQVLIGRSWTILSVETFQSFGFDVWETVLGPVSIAMIPLAARFLNGLPTATRQMSLRPTTRSATAC